MDNIFKNIIQEHTQLREWLIAVSAERVPEVKDIESIIPRIRLLLKTIETINTKHLPYQQYHQLENICNGWNSMLSYYNLQIIPCRLQPFLWVSPKVAIKRCPRKSIEGIVVSNKMEKTAIIEVVTMQTHPKYGKTIRKTKRYKIHDPLEECSIGDKVLAFETRRISKTKHFIFYRKLY